MTTVSGLVDAVRRIVGRDPARDHPTDGRRVALVYRGPATTEGCPEAVAALLSGGPWDLDVRYVGHRSDPLTATALAQALLYAQPGGGELEPAYQHLSEHRRAIREFVAGGGGYLGFCLGAYLAGASPGFGLLPGDTDRYISSKRATVTHDRDTLVDVRWRDRPRALFFQDGPRFLLDASAYATVLACYPNRKSRRWSCRSDGGGSGWSARTPRRPPTGSSTQGCRSATTQTWAGTWSTRSSAGTARSGGNFASRPSGGRPSPPRTRAPPPDLVAATGSALGMLGLMLLAGHLGGRAGRGVAALLVSVAAVMLLGVPWPTAPVPQPATGDG
jgi:hypothetical protein